jgi:coenzyme Q-binding protein COQ10
MPTFRTTRRVAHSAADMFDLVADVEKYPLFLPMCTGLAVRERRVDEQGRDVITAVMSVGYKAIRESFTSRVTLDRDARKILVEYIDGPFRYLENVWSFIDVETGDGDARPTSDVDFFIDYEFRSRVLGMLMGGLFDAAFRKFAEAFEQRADRLYRRRDRLGASPAAT